jgi:hypothetical protein
MGDLEDVRVALATAIQFRDFNKPGLHDSVVEYARNARAAGVLPERLLVRVKSLVHEHAGDELSDWWRSVLTDRLVRWAIESYYGIDGSGVRDAMPGA